MTKADIDRVGEIIFESFRFNASKFGYAPRLQSVQDAKSWVWSMLRHGPSEHLIIEVDNRIAGMCSMNPRGELGGVGPMAIDASIQSKGIGRELMVAIIERAEGQQGIKSIRGIQEAFNPASFSLLYPLGYIPVADILELILPGGSGQMTELCNNVSELMAQDFEEVHAYDSPRSKLDRHTDLTYYARWGKIFVYRSQLQIRGYLVCLPGAGSVQLGPLVAEGEEEAESLFRHALAIFKGRSCRTCVMARDYLLARALMGLGFKLYCISLLIIRGAWRPGQCVEAFGRFPEGV